MLGDADPAVTAGALDYLAVISTLFVILGFLMIFRNTLQGLGYSTMAVISGVGELIGRSFGGWLALHGLGFLGISLANPIAWGFALCYCAFMVTRMLRKEIAGGKTDKGPPRASLCIHRTYFALPKNYFWPPIL